MNEVETARLKSVLENMQSTFKEKKRSIPMLLTHLLDNAERNLRKVPQQKKTR